MSTIRVGATKKFADNWDNIFGGKKKAAGKPAAKTATKSAKKKAAAKPAAKKRPAKKKRG